MRLTLRNLLAYMDDILEPDDAQELGKRIEENQTATTLMHRIRDVIRRLRLGAPSVGEQRSGLDANTVAEYLDHTMPPDRVPDFEKVCLESDMHLAEVASCHQILTLVLGEPAEVDPVSRQKMYQLPDLVAAQVKAAQEAAATTTPEMIVGNGDAALAEPKEPQRRAKPAVPDYLRQEAETRRRRWSIATTLAVVAALIVVAIVIAQRIGVAPRMTWLSGQGAAPQGVVAPSPPERPAVPGAGDESGLPTGPGAAPEAEEPADDSTGPAEEAAAPERESSAKSDEARPEPPADKGVMPKAESEPAEKPVTDLAKEKPGDEPGPPSKPEVDQVASLPKPSGLVQPPLGPAEKTEPAAADTPPLPPERVGQYISPKEILLKIDGDPSTWTRLADQAILGAGTRCLSLPTYRPVVLMAEDVHLQLVDATRVAFLPNDPQSEAKIPGVAVEDGRVVITTERNAQARLRVQAGARKGTIQFAEVPATVAIVVDRQGVAGLDPETQPAPLAAYLFVTRGKIVWQEDAAAGTAVAVDAKTQISLADVQAKPVAATELPRWIDASTISLLDQRASGTVERELAVKPGGVLVALRELADHRQKEVRWLALRSLGALGDFELLVAALDDPKQKALWPVYLEELQGAVARGPVSAAQVRTAFERVYSAAARGAGQQADGTLLYELLWRYQVPELTAADAARLVEYLDHKTLAVRVLAFADLKRITNRGLYYEPEETAAKREPAVQKWKERLKASPTLKLRETETGEEPPPAQPDPKTAPLPPSKTAR